MSTVMPSAVQRLEHSRERLRVAMRAISAPPESAHAAAAPLAWLEAVKSIPGVDIVLATLQRWWAQHPLRAASDATGQAVQAIVAPIARRHPVLLVLSAVLVGTLLARSRPWRWILEPALLAALLPQLFPKAAVRASSFSWLSMLASLAQEAAAPRHEPTARAAQSAAPPQSDSAQAAGH